MGDPDFTWDYCWATQMAELVLGECPASYSCEVLVLVIAVMEFLLLRFAAIILMARSPIIIATPIFSPSAVGRTPTVRGESQVVDVAGSVDRIERLADGHCHHNWLYAGVGVTSQVSSPFRISQVLCFCSRSISADTPLAEKRNCGGKAIDCIEGIACF